MWPQLNCRSMARRSLLVPTVLLLFVFNLPSAGAHAEIQSVAPAPHSIVPDARELVVTYGEPVSAARSEIRLHGPSDFTWRTPSPTTVGESVKVTLPALRPGTYVATWTTTADDGHVQPNATTFAVGSASRVRVTDASAQATTTTNPKVTTTRKGAKSVKPTKKSTNVRPATTVPERSTSAEITARTDAGSVAATMQVRVSADGRLAITVTVPTTSPTPDAWSLSATSPLTDGGSVPIPIQVANGARTATAGPVLLPPGAWKLRLSLVRGFDEEDSTTALSLALV
jgi:methionine-rich copper-binding protein CopC